MTKHYFLLLLLLVVIPSAHASDNTTSFLSSCSGVTITSPNTKLVAYANCMGRVRGYADGHMISVMLHNAVSHNNDIDVLWCIPQSQTDGQVIQSVLSWIDLNKADFTGITHQYKGVTGAYTVITKALVDKYPCKR